MVQVHDPKNPMEGQGPGVRGGQFRGCPGGFNHTLSVLLRGPKNPDNLPKSP